MQYYNVILFVKQDHPLINGIEDVNQNRTLTRSTFSPTTVIIFLKELFPDRSNI